MADDYGFDAIFESEGVNDDPAAEDQEEIEEADEEIEETEDDGMTEPDDDQEEEPEQSDADNARYAAARRKAERERDEAVAEKEREFGQLLSMMGVHNPYTGEVVRDINELRDWADRYSKEQQEVAENRLKEAGLSDEDVMALVSQHPLVRKAAEDKARLEALERKVDHERLQGVFNAELKEIQKYDPSIKTPDDYFNHEKHEEMEALVKRGYRISDAYYIANKDSIAQRTAAASARETATNIRGKDHLDKSKSRGDGGFELDADTIAQFKALNPHATTEEIRAFCEKDSKRMKKGRN